MANVENNGTTNVVPQTDKKPKKKHRILKVAIVIVAAFFLFMLLADDDDTDSNKEVKHYTLKEMKEKSTNFDYKKVAREPEKYTGKFFKATIYIDEVINDSVKSGSSKYYKAYVYDKKEKSEDYDKFLWLHDFQSGKDKTKLLEGDVIEAYVVFDGMGDSKNSLTGEESEDVSLDLYHAKLIKE